MIERNDDFLKAAGLCPHGNTGRCESCSAAARFEKLREEVRDFIDGERSKELSEDRKNELSRELTDVAGLLDGEKIDFFVAGGTGLDLLDGTWDRDHQDLDVAIFDQDRERFSDMAAAQGFMITDPDRKILQREDVTDPARHNAFLFRSDERGQRQFEIMFMPGDRDRVTLSGGASLEGDAFQNAPKVDIEGREVRLQPPEMILFHKLADGRRKDFEDVQKAWERMTEDERERLQRLIDDAGRRFAVGDHERSSVRELLEEAARENDKKRQEFFGGDLRRAEAELSAEYELIVREMHSVRQGADSKEAFLEKLVEKYQGFMPARRVIIEKITEYLFGESSPPLEDFKEWARSLFKLEERIKPKALNEYISQKLWEVREK